MITFKADLADTLRPWAPASGAWVSGESWIRPFQHRALEQVAFSDGARFCLTVREIGSVTAHSPRVPPGGNVSSAEYDAIFRLIGSEHLNEILIEIRPNEIILRAGAMGMAPLYLASRGTELRGSWDIVDLKGHMSASRLNEGQVACMLAHRGRYGHATIFDGISQLTERSRACFTRAGIRLCYPPAARHFMPRELAPGADVVTGFGRLLDSTIAKRPVDPARTAVHLSGGQDSASVALTLAARFPGELTSGAIALPGPEGAQQMRRRDALIMRCGFEDITVSAMDHLPLSLPGPRWAKAPVVSPMDEPYAEANMALLGALSAAGADVLYTGFGGDEVVSPRGRERSRDRPAALLPPWLGQRLRNQVMAPHEQAPLPMVPETTLMALAAASPVMLRAGFWPVAPFSDQALVRFGEWLPLQWRKEKRLLRERILRLGLPSEVAYPALPENFAAVMTAGIQRNCVPVLARTATSGLLADLGFVDRAALLAASERAAAGPEGTDNRLYAVAALECALRQIEGVPTL